MIESFSNGLNQFDEKLKPSNAIIYLRIANRVIKMENMLFNYKKLFISDLVNLVILHAR